LAIGIDNAIVVAVRRLPQRTNGALPTNVGHIAYR
jgi:hypothetical protein